MTAHSIIHQIREGFSDTFYIWKRELRQVGRDQAILLFFVIVPLFYPLLYSWIYTNEVVREVPTAVVDRSHTAMSRAFVRSIDASPDVRVVRTAVSLAAAHDMVGRRQVRGVIVIPEDFSVRVNRGEQSVVPVYCDMSNMLDYKAIYQTTLAAALRLSADIQVERSHSFTQRDAELSTEPLVVHEEALFNTTGGYGNAVIPAVLMIILHQTLLLGVGLAAGTARENNRYRELVPISRHYNGIFRIVLGKSLCYIMIYMVMGTWLGLVVPHLFSFTAMNRAAVFFPFLLVYVLASTFFAMTCSCLVHHRENVMLLVMFMSVPLLFLSGVSWPQSNMPQIWEWVSWLFPSTFGQRGYLRISSMGASAEDIAVEYRALCIQTVVYMMLTCVVYRYQMALAARKAAHTDAAA